MSAPETPPLLPETRAWLDELLRRGDGERDELEVSLFGDCLDCEQEERMGWPVGEVVEPSVERWQLETNWFCRVHVDSRLRAAREIVQRINDKRVAADENWFAEQAKEQAVEEAA